MLALGAISYVYVSAPSILLSPFYPLRYEEAIAAASERYNVDPFLICAVIETESQWDALAESGQGAVGLMQVLPSTAEDVALRGLVNADEYDPADLVDPETNIMYGTAYLSFLIDYFDGSTDFAVAAYNAGPGNAEMWIESSGALHNAITFPETQAYLIKVRNAHARYQELYAGTFIDL